MGQSTLLSRRIAKPSAAAYDSGMPDARRSRGPLLAVVVLALLIGVAVVVLLTRGGGDGPKASTPVLPPSRTSSPAAPSIEAAPLTSAPTGVTWQLFKGVALPTSTEDGPSKVAGPVHAGFSRTPTGALLAAAQIAGRSIIEPSLPALRQIGEQQLAPGLGQTAYLNLVKAFKDNAPPAAGFAQYVGFRYITYSPDVTVVSLATRGSSGRLQVGTNTLRWLDGDWKLELPASGLQQPQVVQNLSGYVPWAGVS